jgi:hypothetical protein
MTQMVRKQVYIHRRQLLLLKRVARARGASESEIIRQALERELATGAHRPAAGGESALDDFVRLVTVERTDVVGREPIVWRREDAYADRGNRWRAS